MKRLKQFLFLSALVLAAGSARAQSAFGNALSLFSSSSQYVSVPSAVWFNGPFTVEAWVYLRSYADWSRLFDFGNGGPNNNVFCALTDGGSGQPYFKFWNGTTDSGSALSPVALPLNAWTHLAVVFDGINGSILINGTPVVSGAMAVPANVVRTSNYIGRSNFAGDATADAILDEFRIWNTARTPAQIQTNLSAPLTGSEPNLLLYYRFDSASGTVATNSAAATGTAYNGTLVNGPAWVVSTVPSWVVLNTNDSGVGSLRNTISTAPAGSTITFAANLSGATITLTNSELLLNKNLTIDASTLFSGITLNGNNAHRIFEIASGTTNVLVSLTVTNGNDDNDQFNGGGAILNAGYLSLTNCTLSGNHADGGNNGGGGILNRGNLWLTSCTLSGNHADNSGEYGGGIWNSGTVILNQSTLSGNHADNPGIGGGIYNSGTVILNQSTLSGNSASPGYGGGIYNNGILNLTNSIVAGNSNHNIDGNNSVNASGGVNLTNGAPQLAALGNYGGPTQTMPPVPGSPAIDGCTSGTIFTTDQRGNGYPRVMNAYADIGAVETLVPSIPNSSFEADTFTVNPGYASGNGGKITGWTITGSGCGLNPASGTPFANNGATPAGANVAFMQGANTLSNTISGLTPGATYRVSFRANSRSGFAAPTSAWSLNGGAFAPFTATPSVGVANPYYINSGDFIATGTTAALAVANQNPADTTVLLDAFVVGPVSLAVVTLAATGVSNTLAQLNGMVTPNTNGTIAWFEWGTAANNYSQMTTPVAVASGTGPLAFSNNLSGLTPGTNYHHHALASNAVSVVRGKDVSFGSPAFVLGGALVVTTECHFAFTDLTTRAFSEKM